MVISQAYRRELLFLRASARTLRLSSAKLISGLNLCLSMVPLFLPGLALRIAMSLKGVPFITAVACFT